MDQMVLKTQVWLNETYGNDARYNIISENGQTGWNTIYALTRALQIELGITTTADNFGPSTQARFTQKYPQGIMQQEDDDPNEDNVYAIIQGALWCKGYSTGNYEITKHFYSGTAQGIMSLKLDALGSSINIPDSTVTLNIMKALLSMNQYVLLKSYGGTEEIRTIQQNLNREYEDYVGLMPTDGLYGREMNQALIKVLQAIEGLSPAEANGNFGPTTKRLCPIVPPNENPAAIKLIKYALTCNGIVNTGSSVTWDTLLYQNVINFQVSVAIPVTGVVDLNTWMSLLLSSGNPERSATVCDTRFEITDSRADQLINLGYKIVGRYLTGGEFKELRKEEPQRILNKGLSFFPIFQESGSDLSYFTYARGAQDAISASNAADNFRLPTNTVIYFAVDMDVLGGNIDAYIKPYFQGVYSNISNKYMVGIYGTRNVCTQILSTGYAETCFVSDMSTGYSGNMGFKMPNKWNFDQFAEIPMDPDWAIDKVGYSESYPAVSSLEGVDIFDILSIVNKICELETAYKAYYEPLYQISPSVVPPLTSKILALGVTNFLRRKNYKDRKWTVTTGRGIDEAFVEYIEKNYPELDLWFLPYIDENPQILTDAKGGEIDLAHLMATTECYVSSVLPKTWAGWAGDLATGMGEVQREIDQHPELDITKIAQKIIGSPNSTCNYVDLCCDADSIKLAELILEASSSEDHPVSNAIQAYYTTYYQNRYSYYLKDLDSKDTLEDIQEAVYLVANSKEDTEDWGIVSAVTILNINRIPDEDVNRICCNVFGEYLYSRIL